MRKGLCVYRGVDVRARLTQRRPADRSAGRKGIRQACLVTEGWTLPATACVRIGWGVAVEERSFEAALLLAMSTSEFTLAEMGASARSIVCERFSWTRLPKQACSLYASLLNSDHKSYN